MKIIIRDKRYLQSGARKLLGCLGKRKIVVFYGSLGSGKTTIIKAICKVLGAVDIVSSPTFTLVNEYKTSTGESLYHIDLYRIRKPDEVFDLGIEEYLSSGSYCFIEWPEMAEGILPPGRVNIRIIVGNNDLRILEIL